MPFNIVQIVANLLMSSNLIAAPNAKELINIIFQPKKKKRFSLNQIINDV